MKYTKAWGLSLVAALLLGACGGGDPDVPGSGGPSGAPTTPGNFTSLVVFGDSLSDIGTYTPATSVTGDGNPPYLGGKFTTNSDGVSDPIWVQNVAAELGLTITPAEVGFAGISVPCPAANTTCTGYAQGGAQVTNPNGIGHLAGAGALTVPVVTQIANHLARFTSFKDTDLIFVYAGSNDLFVHFAAFGATAAQIKANALAGNITADEANVALFNAQTVAQAAMKTAALELAGYVRDQILAKGGKYVAVMMLSDIADTPLGNSAPVLPARQVLTDLSRIFNLWLTEGLTGQPVRFIDTFALFKEVYNNPSLHHLDNVTDSACSVAAISAITGGAVTNGSSLFCNSTPNAPYNGLVGTANVNTWEFADDVHPTTGGHLVMSELFMTQLTTFGWR